MQGKQGKSEDFWEKPSTDKHIASLNGTSKLGKKVAHSSQPRRAARGSQASQPPSTPRVARLPQSPRPQQDEKPPQKSRRRLVLIVAGFVVVFLACFFSFAAVNFVIRGISNASGPATTAVDFLSALHTQNYAQAYKDTLSLDRTQEEFTKEAQVDDTCYGPVKTYDFVENSAKLDQDGSQSFSYTIKREKSVQTYQMTLKLQEKDGAWKIVSYGQGLGPQDTPCVK
jgi:hypothetical protein